MVIWIVVGCALLILALTTKQPTDADVIKRRLWTDDDQEDE